MKSPLRAGGRTTGSHGNGGSKFAWRGGALTPLRSLSLQLPVDDVSVIISRPLLNPALVVGILYIEKSRSVVWYSKFLNIYSTRTSQQIYRPVN